jgi:Holliday junction resolvase RusA-like endonuclease
VDTVIEIHVPGEPAPQPRPRVYRTPKGIRAVSVQGKVKTWRERIILAAQQQYVGPPLEGPLMLRIEFYLPRPKRLMRKKDPITPVPCDKKPDLDNLVKAVKDGLGTVVWHNDSQVASLHASKYYAAKGGATGARIVVRGKKPEESSE